MIRYRYTTGLNPPAPVVNVTVVCPATGKRLETQPAQIDTGADRTVLPGATVTALGLVEDGRLLFQGFTGKVVELPVFLVDVHVHDLPAVTVRAVLGENESLILLGRDALNSHRLVLDGPRLALEIGSSARVSPVGWVKPARSTAEGGRRPTTAAGPPGVSVLCRLS